jgi:cytochrome c oxidase subunit II
MARALLVALVILTCGTIYLFVAKIWWMPRLISVSGAAVDREFSSTLLILGFVFVVAQLALGLFVWKYRDAKLATHSTGHRGAEFAWTAITAIVFIALSLAGERTWAELRNGQATSPQDLQVEVTGTQFAWYFRYPGPDGKLGATAPKNVDASLGSAAAIGLDTSDPAAKDDRVISALVVPINREIRLQLHAQDVIHSFFVPDLRLKQDAVPGLNVQAHFEATKLGDYEIVCAELCGLGHYRMHAVLRVVSEDDFQRWQRQQEAAQR